MSLENQESQNPMHVLLFDPSGRSTAGVVPHLNAVGSGISVESCVSMEAFSTLWGAPVLPDLDLVIIDLDEHEKEGFEVAKEIRRRKVQKPEIVFASSNPRITLFDCHQAGAFGLIEKPFNISEIKELATRISERRHFPRIDVKDIHGHVVNSKTNEELKASVGNIGRGGFFLRLDFGQKIPEIGQILDFNIKVDAFPHYLIQGKGIVRWIKGSPGPGVGIEFLTISEENYLVLQAFVELFKVKSYVPVN
ncbi:MAG: PilZ domain-containing protein [Proteobacteria bacterium]|nr:PilZ domain-containing protein [Pseudomonadota bacterium]